MPRLLYIGDVPVESSYHGSALLYRLLQEYPAGRLYVIEGNLLISHPERRLAGVGYGLLAIGKERLLRTRFHRIYSASLSFGAKYRASRIDQIIGNFRPEAVLTVTHGYSWITAAQFAERRDLPLHLICHDDWPRMAQFSGRFNRWLDRTFGKVYRQAKSRFCVSPFMAEEYEKRYGVPGSVLYPSRAIDCPIWDDVPPRLKREPSGLTVAFAGTINSQGVVAALHGIAEHLFKLGGKLLLFGPLTAEKANQIGLGTANIEICGLLPSNELMITLRERADVLFVPISFEPIDRPNMMISFPSKLTDYTAVGLPLLIYGPEYCSAVRWARENSGVAEVVESNNPSHLKAALERLLKSPKIRTDLAYAALAVGERYFSISKVLEKFNTALENRQ